MKILGEMTNKQKTDLLKTLQKRFEEHMDRHPSLNWEEVQDQLEVQDDKLDSLLNMESTGGEPDVIGLDTDNGQFIYVDCSRESPKGRRSLCFDRKALEARKKHKPGGSAMEMAASMGITLLDEKQYRELQKLGEFDIKTSSWVQTPEKIRSLGGALFCDRRYDTVFVYHNGAESYYASRGFRGMLHV